MPPGVYDDTRARKAVQYQDLAIGHNIEERIVDIGLWKNSIVSISIPAAATCEIRISKVARVACFS